MYNNIPIAATKNAPVTNMKPITKNNPVKAKPTNEIPADHNLAVVETSYPKIIAKNGIISSTNFNLLFLLTIRNKRLLKNRANRNG